MRRLISLSRFSELPPDLIIELIEGEYVALGTIEGATAELAKDHVLAALPDPGEEGLAVPVLVATLEESEPLIRSSLNELLRCVPARVARSGAGHKDPYRWSRAGEDGSGFIPFVFLRETHETNETQPRPAPPPGSPSSGDVPR